MPDVEAALLLDNDTRRLHRTLIDTVLLTGDVLSLSVLTGQLRASAELIRDGLRRLAAGDCLAFDGHGQLTCLYPFSVTPTPHVMPINGARRFAMCALDALGRPAMLARELDIEGRCAVCDASVAVRVYPGTIATVTPETTMVVVHHDEAEPAFAACCPFTVFVCGQEHAERFRRRIPGATVRTLPEALQHAEAIFGGLLAEAIPARRPRGIRWEPTYND